MLLFFFRLSKDVQEVSRFPDISVRLTDLPSVASIIFNNDENHLIPSRFLISVPRFYPHKAPIVQCLDKELISFSTCFDEGGNLIHNVITEWRAVNSLGSIIQSLREIRDLYKFGMKVDTSIIHKEACLLSYMDEDLNSLMEEEQ